MIASGAAPDSPPAQEVAAHHVKWLALAIQTPAIPDSMVKSITQMYVDDERFGANYNRVSAEGPEFVRDAVHYWVDNHAIDDIR